MNISKSTENGKLILKPEDRIDTTTAQAFSDALMPAFSEAKNVVLDFSGVPYISSAGLRVLLAGEKAAKSCGGSMTLINISPEVMEVFEMTGFSGVLTIE